MKILHLAAGNRWTGAAAPAFAEVEALRAAGVDAHYAYVGGYKLEAKLRHHEFAHPLIEKAQNPLSFKRTLAALDRMINVHGFDYLHAHLSYDHWLARFAAHGRSLRLARTFHSRRVLRSDVFTRSLISRTRAIFVINDSFRDVISLRGRHAVFTPPPVDLRQFSPAGPDVRTRYGFTAEERIVMAIGKLSKGRGFEDALATFAKIHRELPSARMMIVGHGEHRPALEDLARRMGLESRITWAGYHEEDLAEHYRASNALLFTAKGSDEGHRALLEAMACGVPPAAYPIEGVSALAGDLAPSLLATETTPSALSTRVLANLNDAGLPRRAHTRAQFFGYEAASARLREAYGSAM